MYTEVLGKKAFSIVAELAGCSSCMGSPRPSWYGLTSIVLTRPELRLSLLKSKKNRERPLGLLLFDDNVVGGSLVSTFFFKTFIARFHTNFLVLQRTYLYDYFTDSANMRIIYSVSLFSCFVRDRG